MGIFNVIPRPKSLNEITYKKLREAILIGKLVPGKIYNELSLAKELKVSRTPVREALLRLAAENIIIFHPRKGVTVNHFSNKDIESLFELRQILEETAIAKITRKLSNNYLYDLKNLVAEQENCLKEDNCDEKMFLDLDRKFHTAFIKLCDNRFIVQTFNNIRDFMTIAAKEALMKKGRAREVIKEHKTILVALSKRDKEMAVESLRTHLSNSKFTALEGLKNYSKHIQDKCISFQRDIKLTKNSYLKAPTKFSFE